MKKLIRISALFCSAFLLSIPLFSAHIIGGELTYDCLGYTNGDPNSNSRTYQFVMKIYRDCQGGGAGFDSAPFGAFQASVTIFQGSDQYDIIFLGPPDVTSVDPNPNNPCLQVPTNVCVEEGVYTFDPIDLPIVNESYFISYQRCCRNNSIDNLVDPGGSGATYVMELTPEAQQECNSSPTFNDFPPVVICVGEEFNFDHSATDADGDQLVYEFCSPFLGGGPNTGNATALNGVAPNPDSPPPYDPVNFIPVDFDQLNPLGNDSDISINVATGLITGTPAFMGQFVVGVCVYEFRNGVLMSTIRRDFQFNVTFCEPTVVADVSEDDIINDFYYIESCGDNTLTIINQSYQQSFIDEFRWEFYLDGQTEIIEDWNANITFPGEGNYNGLLILNPGTECGDTAEIVVNIYPELVADFSFDYDTCIAGPIAFTDESFAESGEITNWSWDFGDGNGSSNRSPEYLYKEPGLQEVSLRVTDINGCIAITEEEVSYFPVPDLIIISPSAFTGCAPGEITFNNLSSPVDESYEIIWNFGDAGTSTELSPAHIYEEDGLFSVEVEITSPIGCQTDTLFPDLIEIEPSPVAAFEYSPDKLDVFNPYTEFTDQSSGADRWYWNFNNQATSIQQNPSFTFRDTGLQEVILVVTHPSGCIDSLVQFIDVEPVTTFFFPNAFTPNSDSVNDIFKGEGYIDGLKSYSMQIWNRWGEQIFESNNPADGWNGLKNNSGRMAPPGVYMYLVSYVGPRGEQNDLQGFITLIR